MFAAFGPEPEMQVYGRGLIRRLPPMLDGDPRRIRMVYSLLFALPGTPVLFYGEEIGMGENLAVGSRMAVRTPMQWSNAKNGGFSTARPSRLSGPVVEGAFGPEFVNVVDQLNDPDSLLTFIQRLTRCYRDCPEIGWGDTEILDQPHAACWRCGPPGTTARSSPCTTWPRTRSPCRSTVDGRGRGHRADRLLPVGRSTSTVGVGCEVPLGAIRLRLAPDHRARVPAGWADRGAHLGRVSRERLGSAPCRRLYPSQVVQISAGGADTEGRPTG